MNEYLKAFLFYAGLSIAWIIVILFFAVVAASAKGPTSTAWFTVPDGVSMMRIRSYYKGSEVIDRTIGVKPGQTFRIDTK